MASSSNGPLGGTPPSGKKAGTFTVEDVTEISPVPSEGGGPNAGALVEPEAPVTSRHVTPTTNGSGSLLANKALDQAEKTLDQLAEQAEAVFTLLADAGFSGKAIGRHAKTLIRIADKRGTAALVRLAHRRAAWMEKIGVIHAERGTNGLRRVPRGGEVEGDNPTTAILDAGIDAATSEPLRE